MLARTRAHLTNQDSHPVVFHMTYNHQLYAIPQKIAQRYLVPSHITKVSVPAGSVFANLEKKLTRAGALLKGLRAREGLSQVAFAKKIKITQANLSNMENGRRPLGKLIAKRIEKIFGVDYRYFLS